MVCLLRFLCSFLSGYIVWKDYDYAFSWMTEIGFPGISNMSVDGLCWLYSAVYNATYMLPEAILTTVLVVILIRVAPQIFDPVSVFTLCRYTYSANGELISPVAATPYRAYD